MDIVVLQKSFYNLHITFCSRTVTQEMMVMMNFEDVRGIRNVGTGGFTPFLGKRKKGKDKGKRRKISWDKKVIPIPLKVR